MIGLLSSPSAVLAVDEAAARRAASLEAPKPDAAPIDAVHAVESAAESEAGGAHHDRGNELTTDERLRQQEALRARPHPRRNAVDGEVNIDASREPDPDATIHKMRQVRRAALSPSDPSSQDRSVAAKAAQVIRAAEAELAARRQETLREAAAELEEVRDAAIVDPAERAAAQEQRGVDLADAPPAASHHVSEYRRHAVITSGARLSSMPPPPTNFDTDI